MSDNAGSDDAERSRWRRRLLLLLAVFVLAVVGAGVGTFALGGDDEPASAPAPSPATPTETTNISLSMADRATVLRVDNVTPGESGTERLTLRNDGSDDGVLRIAAVTLTQRENGITGPEAEVDDSPERGELASQFLVELSMVRPDGETVGLFGTGDGSRPLSAVATQNSSGWVSMAGESAATLELSWRLPDATGNEVQSDSLVLDTTFQLQARNETLPE